MHPLYKQKLWDGYVDFFSKKTGKFLTGLVPEVKRSLRDLGYEYEVIDERKQVRFAYEEVDDQFLNRFLPESGKWADGKPAKPITLEDYQVELINQAITHHRGIVKAPTSAGKAQPLDSLVATPTGFKRMGDLAIGDAVLVPSGGSAPITGIFPQGEKKILRIDFTNGQSVECCEDHLWKVNALYDQWEGKILTAKQIQERYKCQNGTNRYNIDTPKKVDFESKSVPIDPYVIGLLLGDGCFLKDAICFSNIDEQIINSLKSSLISGYILRKSKCNPCYYRITCGRRGHGIPSNPYVEIIRKLGLSNHRSYEKFIPEVYLVNDQECRLSVLQGLMDTDGTVDKKGRISFTTTSANLAEGIMWLIHSLGGIGRQITVNKSYTYLGVKKNGRQAYTIHFTLPEGVLPFRLERKISRCNMARTRNKNRIICNVIEIGKKECQCIVVDHPDHLYITDNFVVTHNSFIAMGIILSMPRGTPILVLGNRTSVVRQMYKDLIKWGVPNVGMCDGETHKPNIITCAMVQSIEHMQVLLPKFRALIVDEVHMMMNATAIACYKKLKACSVRIAISATPFKFENNKTKKTEDPVHKYNVKGYFGPLFTTIADPSGTLQTKTLQDRGRLSKSRCTFYPIDEPQIPYDIYIDAVTNGIAKSWHFHEIVSRLAKSLTGRTLILVERIAHGDALHNLIPNSIWVRGKDNSKTRDWVIEQLQEASGNVVAIATQGIFNAGINVFVHNLINAAGGKAEHDIIQRMGRGLRTADDKEILNYYDFIFRINNYLEKHSNKRLAILQQEGHDIITKDEMDF